MATTNRTPLQTAIIYGLVSGMALGASEFILVMLITQIPYPLVMLVARLPVVILILAYLYAGYSAARSTSNLFAGTLAGALTGVFGVLMVVLISYIGSFMGLFMLFDPQSLGIPFSLPLAGVMASPLVNITLTFAGYGALVGTLGGFIGKQRSLH
ncbi:MAG TPA: hypothetical protein VGD98_20335 [Ktedonobacteraceae bacterium]